MIGQVIQATMSLSSGIRLGHNAVTALLGEGGMGDDVSLRSMNRSQESGVRSQMTSRFAR